MRYDDTNLRELLAAEYVLGTLHGPARRRYETLLNARPDWQQAANWWLARLHLLADTVPAVTPSAQLWRGIETRLYGTQQPSVLSSALGWWRGLALVSSTMAIALAFFVASNLLKAPPMSEAPSPTTVALLSTEEAKPGWILTLAKSADGKTEMHMTTLASVASAPGKSFELWVLPADKSKPISLGLMPKAGNASVRIADNIAQMLASSGLAVSLEPEGGSPTGQPTGAVLYQGKLTQI